MKVFIQTVLQGGFLLGLAAIGALASYHWHPERPNFYLSSEPMLPDEISVEAALALGDEVIWLDARASSEYEKDHIPKALSLNEANWDEMMLEHTDLLLDQTKSFVVYCDRQACDASRKIADKLESLGHPNVKVLRGGWRAWLDRK